MLQDLKDSHSLFFFFFPLLSFRASFSLMLLCSLRQPDTVREDQPKIHLGQSGKRPSNVILGASSAFPTSSHPTFVPRELGKRFPRAEPLLLTSTSIYPGEKPSRAEIDIYISHHGNALVSEEADEMPPG